MRIGFYTSRVDKPDTGPGIYRRSLFSELKQQLGEQHELYSIHFSDYDDKIYNKNEVKIEPNKYLRNAVVSVGKVAGKNIKNPTEVNFSELKLMLENKFDLLHLQSVPWYRPFWLAKINTKIATTIHFSVRRIIHPSFYSRNSIIKHKYLYPQLLNIFDGIFTVSEYAKQIHSEIYGIPKNRMFVTHNAPPPGFGQDANMSLESNIGIENDYIIHVSNGKHYKNPEGVIKGYRYAKNEYNLNLDLVLVGNNWRDCSIYDAISDNSVQNSIHKVGYVERDQLIQLYSEASFLYLPSYSEAFPFVIMESLSCGTPILTTAECDMPSLFKDAGLYIQDVENIEQLGEMLCKMSEEYKHLENNVQRVVENYTWKKSARQTISGYEKIL
jgi:glycosyltransferase involved in cell wall biosynthesis